MKRIMLYALIGATGLTLTACKDGKPPFNEIPDFVQGDINQTSYDGTLTSAEEAVQFRTDLTEQQRAMFDSNWPDRFAWKHAHSKANPEADWGLHVLQSIEFGFYVLNEKFGRELGNGETLLTIKPKNTLVIASSVSNGGGSSVRAAEQDTRGLIDGVAVSEPNVNPEVDHDFTIRQGEGPVITEHSRSLLDYTTALAVYQGCANQAPVIRDTAPLNAAFNPPAIGENICNSLANKGLVTGATLDDRATDALRILNEEFGIQPEQNLPAINPAPDQGDRIVFADNQLRIPE